MNNFLNNLHNIVTPEVMANLEMGLLVTAVTFIASMTAYCVVKKDFRF